MLGSRRGAYEKRRSPWIILAIVAATVLVITLIVGNLLPLLLNDAALEALRGGEDTPTPTPSTSTVKRLHAYAYTLGDALDSVWESPHASVTLNFPSGALTYASPVATHLGFVSYRSEELSKCMEELDEAASYISGVFYPLAPTLSSEELRDAEALREAALMREFLRAGGDELVLRGLPFEDGEIELSQILSYVETVSATLGDTPVVIAIPLSALEGKTAHRLLTRLAKVADRLALDLGAADGSLSPEEWLAECDYYLEQYEMRLLLSETQTDLIVAAEDLPDLQTFSRIPDDQRRDFAE